MHAALTTVTVGTATTAGVLTGLLAPSGRRTQTVAGAAPAGPPRDWDDAVLSARITALAAHSLGFGLATTGRLLRIPRLPLAVAAPVTLVDYQPAVRRVLESSIGRARTDLLLSTLTAASFTLVQAPPPLAIEAMLRASVVREVLANRRAWKRSPLDPAPANRRQLAVGAPSTDISNARHGLNWVARPRWGSPPAAFTPPAPPRSSPPPRQPVPPANRLPAHSVAGSPTITTCCAADPTSCGASTG
ncbi:hypothetical protein P9209_23875 [Prescottella defluvii]|nr:hypothetical protein P9209_23875 [Prescottella defluvii]